MGRADSRPWNNVPFVSQGAHFVINEGLKVLWDSIYVYCPVTQQLKRMVYSRTFQLLKKELVHASAMV